MQYVLSTYCGVTAQVFDFHQYREPGAITCNGAGPLPLQDFISQRAPTLLAQYADDATVLSERCHNYSYEERARLLHRTWDALHQYTSLQQIREWLERLSVPGLILLVLVRAAYLNCQPDYLATFGKAKSTFGEFSSGTFIVERHVAIAAVTLPYFLVRSLRNWVGFCTSHSVRINDFWNMTPEQELQFAALGTGVFPAFVLCMAMLIHLVNYCSDAYRHELTIELLLQRQVHPCKGQPESGLTLMNVDGNLAMQSYFLEEQVATHMNDDSGRTRLESAVTWAKQ